MSVQAQKKALGALEHPQWDIQNTSTKWAGRIFVALLIIASLGAIATFAMHGAIAGYGSYAMIFGVNAAAVAGVIYVGLKIRDLREKSRAKRDWEVMGKTSYAKDISGQRAEGMALVKSVQIGKNTYFLIGKNGEDHVTIQTQNPLG